MRVFFNRIRQLLSSRLWAWPTVTGLTGAVLAVTLSSVTVPTEAFLARFLWPGDSSAAASMLSFIASATLTVLTTTISMTLIVMQVASGNFSHQLLSDFISSRAVRGIMAVYVGVFTYTLLLLRSMDSKADRPPQVGMTVAMLLVFVAVATFIWYLSRVVDMVRVDSIIDESARRSLKHAAELQAHTTEEPVERPEVPDDAERLTASGYGYVRAVDLAHAATWANEHGATVVFEVRPGDAVVKDQTVARYWGMMPNGDGDRPSLPMVVYLDVERVSGQDFSLGLRQIYDIAVRALSSGVNDPTTAQHAIGLGSTVLRSLARQPIHAMVRHASAPKDSDRDHGRLLVWSPTRPLSELLQSFVGGVRRYAGEEPDIYVALLRLLSIVTENCDPDVLAVARQERDRIVSTAQRQIQEPADLERVVSAARAALLAEEPALEEGV